MGKESYVRGFCKVAEAHGVDPVALAKYAQQVSAPTSAPPARVKAAPESDAGIGSLADNFGRHEWVPDRNSGTGKVQGMIEARTSKPHKGSYAESLRRLSGELGPFLRRSDFTRPFVKEPDQNSAITQGALEGARRNIAEEMSGKIFPKGTNAYRALVANLIRAGEQNQKSYVETGSVQPRKEVDRTGIEKLKLPPLIEEEDPETKERLKGLGVETMDDWLRLLQNSIGKNDPSRLNGNIA